MANWKNQQSANVHECVHLRFGRFVALLILVATCVSCQRGEKDSRQSKKAPDTNVKENELQEQDLSSVVERVRQLGGKIETNEADANQITLIDFSNCHSVDSDTIHQLGRIPTLKSLFLLDTAFDEQGLPYLSNFPNLENLDLKGAKISDQGLSKLPPLEKLCFLGLSGTQVTDEGIMKLTELSLPSLKFLQLNFTEISDAAKSELTDQIPGLKVVL